jgi:hypothetical protein
MSMLRKPRMACSPARAARNRARSAGLRGLKRACPQDGGLVVDLHPVASHPMADPPSLWSAFGVGDHLSLQGRVQLAAQEAEHVL